MSRIALRSLVARTSVSRLVVVALAACVVLPTLRVQGQGVLVDEREDQHYRLPRPIVIWPPHRHPPIPRPRPRPEPEPVYRIKELGVHVDLKDQIAKVQVSQSFENKGSRQLEVSFVFPLPYDGAIDQMTFMVDGKEYDAKLLDKDEARRIYERHVRRNKDPALVEWIGTGMFKTSVFPVPPGATRTVTLKFSQLCRKQQGLTELLFPLSTAKYTSEPVSKVEIEVNVRSQGRIKNIYSPTHAVEIDRSGDKTAKVKYEAKNEIPTSDFRLLYDASEGLLAANVLSYKPQDDEDGYFLLLVTPDITRAKEKPLPKTVIFVVDRSGSMSGKKIEQAKGALRFVLNNLREGDLFNIVAYDNGVESFRPELQRFDEEQRKAALGYVEGLYAGGSTNIDGALKAALEQLQDESRPSYIVFLTDGLPTAGERNEAKIAENAREYNKVRARIFSFGVGYDVNSRLLDKISRSGFGQSQYVRPNEDIEAHVSQLYARIGAPVLTDVSITFDQEDFPAERGKLVNRVYPSKQHDLFAGEQLVVAGRYKQGGAAKVTIAGKIDGEKRSFHFPAEFVKRSKDDTFAFAERLWAMRRVGEIIEEIDLNGKNDELVDELVELAKKHGILTPYTSFLADEEAQLHDLVDQQRRAGRALERLRESSGVSGFVQRDMKAQLQQSTQAAPLGFGGFAPSESRGARGGVGAAPAAAGAPAGGAVYRRLEDDAPVAVTSVRQIGPKTFYLRDGRWIDSTITASQEKKVQKVERYTREYFDLVAKYGRELGSYLAVDDTIVVVLDGQAYEF